MKLRRVSSIPHVVLFSWVKNMNLYLASREIKSSLSHCHYIEICLTFKSIIIHILKLCLFIIKILSTYTKERKTKSIICSAFFPARFHTKSYLRTVSEMHSWELWNIPTAITYLTIFYWMIYRSLYFNCFCKKLHNDAKITIVNLTRKS